MESDVTPAAILDYTECQTFLRLDGTTDQALVEALISAVTKKVEDYLGRKLITQVWSIYYDFFPTQNNPDTWWDGARDGAVSELYSEVRYLELPFGPCQSVYFVKTFDGTDGGSVFDASLYQVDTIGMNPKIALRRNSTWPSTSLRTVNGIQVKATLGYGATGASVPSDIKEAVKICVAKLYENRGDVVIKDAIPTTAQMLLDSHRKWKV
jgi:hypothetical protein